MRDIILAVVLANQVLLYLAYYGLASKHNDLMKHVRGLLIREVQQIIDRETA